MTSLLHNLTNQYNEYMKNFKDPRVDTWPMMSGPLFPVSIVALYLYFVLKAGPQFMEKRKPFNLQQALIIYNFMAVLISLYLTLVPILNGYLILTLGTCHPKYNTYHKLSYEATSYSWLYLMTKFVELADTVFFVLRKKDKQISFLHIFHHSSIIFIVWFHLKYLPGMQGVVCAFVNSFVHIIMYFYYMVAAMGSRFQKYIWWKKYVTWIQLVQFFSVMLYTTALLLFECELPKPPSVYFFFVPALFMVLFINFYRKTYIKKSVD